MALEPFLGHDGVLHYEIKRIYSAHTHKKLRELWVEWQGYVRPVAERVDLAGIPHAGCPCLGVGL